MIKIPKYTKVPQYWVAFSLANSYIPNYWMYEELGHFDPYVSPFSTEAEARAALKVIQANYRLRGLICPARGIVLTDRKGRRWLRKKQDKRKNARSHMDESYQRFLRNLEADPESIQQYSYEQIFSMVNRSGQKELVIAPYITGPREDLHSSSYHRLYLQLSLDLECEEYKHKDYIEIGNVTASEDRVNVHPYYFRQYVLRDLEWEDAVVGIFPDLAEERDISPVEILNEVFCNVNTRNFSTFLRPGGILSLPQDTIDIIHIEEQGAYQTRDEFINEITASMWEFADQLINQYQYFKNNPVFNHEIDSIAVLPYLFGQENF